MNNSIPFVTLQRFLVNLGFKETPYRVEKPIPSSHVLFKHPDSGVLLIVDQHRPKEKVDPATLISVRKHLVDSGLVAEEAFEDLLHKSGAE
jgi:predicted RNA binding protein YcfA (HicA-like mRNA interferase family)